jgi:hypothetical protein
MGMAGEHNIHAFARTFIVFVSKVVGSPEQFSSGGSCTG